ncbi:hypothetical protein KR018_000153, partial [Drosophila ironensis]
CFQLVLILYLIALVCAAPVAQSRGDPTVSVLRYRDEKDFEAIQRAIIAQYQKVEGSTQIHAPQVASVINPAALQIHI